VEAIALTLPSHNLNQSIAGISSGGVAGTLNSGAASDLLSNGGSSSTNNSRYEDHCIRELAFDLGVDPRALKGKLSTIFAGSQIGGGISDQNSASDKSHFGL
jgi:hypothetical protein